MEIKKICVLGAGLMGSGIAQVAAEAGYEVGMRDIEDRFVQGGLNYIRKNCGSREWSTWERRLKAPRWSSKRWWKTWT